MIVFYVYDSNSSKMLQNKNIKNLSEINLLYIHKHKSKNILQRILTYFKIGNHRITQLF